MVDLIDLRSRAMLRDGGERLANRMITSVMLPRIVPLP